MPFQRSTDFSTRPEVVTLHYESPLENGPKFEIKAQSFRQMIGNVAAQMRRFEAELKKTGRSYKAGMDVTAPEKIEGLKTAISDIKKWLLQNGAEYQKNRAKYDHDAAEVEAKILAEAAAAEEDEASDITKELNQGMGKSMPKSRHGKPLKKGKEPTSFGVNTLNTKFDLLRDGKPFMTNQNYKQIASAVSHLTAIPYASVIQRLKTGGHHTFQYDTNAAEAQGKTIDPSQQTISLQVVYSGRGIQKSGSGFSGGAMPSSFEDRPHIRPPLKLMVEREPKYKLMVEPEPRMVGGFSFFDDIIMPIAKVAVPAMTLGSITRDDLLKGDYTPKLDKIPGYVTDSLEKVAQVRSGDPTPLIESFTGSGRHYTGIGGSFIQMGRGRYVDDSRPERRGEKVYCMNC